MPKSNKQLKFLDSLTKSKKGIGGLSKMDSSEVPSKEGKNKKKKSMFGKGRD